LTRTIKAAIRKIAEHDRVSAPPDATIHTGIFCSYEPDPRLPLAWAF